MRKILTLLFMVAAWLSFAQTGNVGVNTTTPDAVLEVYSTTKGVLVPRLTTAQRDAMVSPLNTANKVQEGTIIYNLDQHCLQYNVAPTGTTPNWVGYGCDGLVLIPGSITTLNCEGATTTGTLTAGKAASGVSSSVPYTGGNGGSYAAQTVTSTGVTGLTATLTAGKINYIHIGYKKTVYYGSGLDTFTINGIYTSIDKGDISQNITTKVPVLNEKVDTVELIKDITTENNKAIVDRKLNKEIEKQISDNSLEIQKTQKKQRDLIIKENKLKEELRNLKNQVMIKPIIKTQECGGKNNIIGKYVTVLLKIKDYQISGVELNTYKILNLNKQNIIDIYDEKEKYNIAELEKVIKKESYDRLKAFFIFNGELQ